jgi:hypothetical protein
LEQHRERKNWRMEDGIRNRKENEKRYETKTKENGKEITKINI